MVIYDDNLNKATGVRVIDTKTKAVTEYFAKIIFVNAASLNTNLILLNSTSNRFANGIGNDNSLMGNYMTFHNYRGRVEAPLGFKEYGFLKNYYKAEGRYIDHRFMALKLFNILFF